MYYGEFSVIFVLLLPYMVSIKVVKMIKYILSE